MQFHTFVEVCVAMLLAGFAFGAPSLNDVDLDEKDVNDADVYIDQRQNGTENYKINLSGVSIIWTPLSSLITASGLLDSPFGSEQNSEDEVNDFLFKSGQKHLEKNGLNTKQSFYGKDKKKPSVEILPIEIIEDKSPESGGFQEKEGSNVVLVEETKSGKEKNGFRKRKISISDFLKPFVRRNIRMEK